MKRIETTTDRMGGLNAVYAIPLSCFGDIEMDYATGRYTITLSSTDGVLALPTDGGEACSFDEQHDRDDNGDYWQPVVSGVIPSPGVDNAIDIEALERGEWLVLCEDGLGNLRLCGDADVQLTFATETVSGVASSERNQVSYTFTGKLGHPSRILATTLDELFID